MEKAKVDRIAAKARRRLVDAKGILLACCGTLARPFLDRRPAAFRPGAVRGPCRGPVAEGLAAIVAEFAATRDERQALAEAHKAILTGMNMGAFAPWVRPGMEDRGKAMLCQGADHLTGRRWKLQIFYIPEHQSHAPHSHTDVASCLVVARGKLHAREYDRHRQLEHDSGLAMLSLASDGFIERGEALLSTAEQRDVHWFGAVEGSAIAFNFQMAGFRRGIGPFEPLRVYVDPTGVARTGVHPAAKLGRKQARKRFRYRPLSDLPPPEEQRSIACTLAVD